MLGKVPTYDQQTTALPDQRAGSPDRSLGDGLGPRFHPPAPRAGVVARASLVDRLLTSNEPVIAVVAPAGYGKTTLLAQYAERFGPYVAWVSCEEIDDDPVALWGAVATSLGGVAPDTAATAAQVLASSGGGVGAVPRLASTLAAFRESVLVVLDNAEVITSSECRASIGEFALRVPPGWRLALRSRERVPTPSARLRTQDHIVEIGTNDLAMTGQEATALLTGAGVSVSTLDDGGPRPTD